MIGRIQAAADRPVQRGRTAFSRSLSSLAALALGTAASLATVGCSGGTSSTSSEPLFVASSAEASILELLAAGPESVPHEGVRLVEIYQPDEFGVLQPLIYREQVAVDDAGSYSIKPLSVDTPVSPDAQTFLLLQEGRGGYLFRYRDFRLRDLNLLVSNYLLNAVASAPVEIAGRSVELLSFTNLSGEGLDYEIWADVETGLALSTEVFDGSGQLIQRTVYESYTHGAPTTFVPYREQNAEIVADLANPDPKVLGVAPIEASILPDGYQLHALSSVMDPDGLRWSLATYTDGVEVVFLLGRNADALPAPDLDGNLAVASPIFGALEGMSDDQGDRLFGYEAGRILILDGRYGDQLRIAVGAQPAELMQAFLESSLP